MRVLWALAALFLLLPAAAADAAPPTCITGWTNVPSAPGPVKLDAGELSHGHIQCGGDEGATLVPTVVQAPQHGVLSELKPLLVFQGASFTYRPDPAYRGRDQFTLRVTDGPHTVDTIFLIDVVAPTNQPPVCTPTHDDRRHEVTAGTAGVFTWACGDYDGGPLAYSLPTPPAHGTATLEPEGFGVRVTYVPAAGHVGADELTVRVHDGPHVIDLTLRFQVVAAPVTVQDPPPATTIAPVTVKPSATVVVGPAAKPVSSPLEKRIAKACGKLKGTRKATCVKRERALAKCGAMKAGTRKQKAAKAACVKQAKRIGAAKPKRR